MRRRLDAGRPWEEWGHAVSKLRRAASMNIMTEDRKGSNTAAGIKRKKEANIRR